MANTARQSNAVGWFELYVADLARAKKFYQGVFQRPMEELATPPGGDMQMCAFKMNEDGTGASGALVKSPKMAPGSGGTLVYFSCLDCAQEASRAADYGGTVLQRKTAIGPYGFIAMVKDTEGNTIGLHSIK
jgi:predicted enzyme related to lactoylglutathione lyase